MTTIKLNHLHVHLGEPIQVTSSISHGWFPSLAKFPTGELLLAYSLAADTNENGLDISGYMLSGDNGQSWSPRYDILPEHQQMIFIPQADGALFALPAYLYAHGPADQHNFHGAATRFEQGGRRVVFEPEGVRLVDWPWPVEILPNPYRDNYHRVNFCFDGDALEIDGRLIATLYGAKAGEAFYQVVVATSEDGGRTWRYLATVAGPEIVPAAEPRGHGPGEPSLVQLASGELMCVMRMGGGAAFPLRRSYSRDNGRTWSVPDVLPAYSVEPSLKRLNNGILALSTGRPGIFLWLANDERGEAWQSIDLLAHHNQWAPDPTYRITPEQTTAYTELIEVSPNHVLIAYDRTPFGWAPTAADSGERNRIFLLPVEIERV
ncbi:MAG: sialidase family protein [Chloroflexi bacterium]|nr:sialidase family protein [Chloroflexota bacterium]